MAVNLTSKVSLMGNSVIPPYYLYMCVLYVRVRIHTTTTAAAALRFTRLSWPRTCFMYDAEVLNTNVSFMVSLPLDCIFMREIEASRQASLSLLLLLLPS